MVSREPGKAPQNPKLTIIVPVYNERETLPFVLEAVKALPLEKQVVVVDNFSTDGTREFLKRLDEPEVEVLLNPRNLGKGASVRRGIKKAKGEFVVVQDADLEYDPKVLPELLRVAEAGDYEVVLGSRVLGLRRGLWSVKAGGALERMEHLSYTVARLFFWLLLRFLFGRPITDPATCYKLMRAGVARSLSLKSTGFDLDFEISAKVLRERLRFCEVPIPYKPRRAKEGKKIRPLDFSRGARAIFAVWAGRL